MLPGLYHAGVRFGATTGSRLVLFGGLYFAQGIPWGFVTVALAFRLTGLGLGAKEIGEITAIALSPWVWKATVGPIVDVASFGRWGRRRPLILGAQVAIALTLLALAGADPRHAYGLFLALVFLNNVFVMVQDVATDALAISLLPESERGRATGVMAAGKWAGSALGGGGLAWFASRAGWPLTYLVAIALLLIPAALVLRTAEGPAPQRPLRQSLDELGRGLAVAFKQRTTWLAAGLALVSGGSQTWLSPLIVPLLKRTALPPGVAEWMPLLSGMAAVAGSLVGGALADRIGRRRAVLIGALGVAAAHLTFAAVTPALGTLLAYQLGAGLTAGILYAATLALFMDLTHPQVAATHFQLFMGLMNLRMMWTAFAGGRMAAVTPTSTMFVIGGLLELVPLALLLVIDPRRMAKSFRHPNDGPA